MAPQFDRPLRDLLRAAGCEFVRQGRGSHEIWYSPITRRNFAVPVGIPSRHTANAILRQAGLPKAFRLDCHYSAATPTVSAITAPRAPSGFSVPTVESRAV